MLIRISLLTVLSICFLGCGQPEYRSKTAKVQDPDSEAIPPQTSCTENGIIAEVGETKMFYRLNQADCTNSCSNSSVIKICQENGTFAALSTPSFPLAQYTHSSCRPIDTSACGGANPPPPAQPPVTPPSTVSTFEQPGCIPIVAENYSYSWGTWPSFNRVQRMSRTSFLSLQFTASMSSTEFGTVTTSGYPGEGISGRLIMSISKTPGCMDRTKLPPNCASPVASTYGGIGWTNGRSPFSCQLTPGETYYLNIFFGTHEPHPSGAICPLDDEGGGSCGRDIANSRQ